MHTGHPDLSGAPPPIRTLKEFRRESSVAERIRLIARNAAIRALASVPRRTASHWIRFPYYHYVFDDERTGFAAQLAYFRDSGDVISLDEAIALLGSGRPVRGRYFCITFDDGFRNCLTNALPILIDNGAPAAFFIPTAFVGPQVLDDPELIRRVSNGGSRVPEFLSWEECRALASAGMTIGSHTINHLLLVTLGDAEVEAELRGSKAAIEREMGTGCHHFSCPKGKPGMHFNVGRDPQIAKRAGYSSFLTTQRGSVHRLPDPFHVERDHLLAEWGVHQLRYFFSR